MTTLKNIENFYESEDFKTSLSSSEIDTEVTKTAQKFLKNIKNSNTQSEKITDEKLQDFYNSEEFLLSLLPKSFSKKETKVLRTIRLRKSSLDIIKAFAEKNNLKYQTLISDAIDSIASNLQTK